MVQILQTAAIRCIKCDLRAWSYQWTSHFQTNMGNRFQHDCINVYAAAKEKQFRDNKHNYIWMRTTWTLHETCSLSLMLPLTVILVTGQSRRSIVQYHRARNCFCNSGQYKTRKNLCIIRRLWTISATNSGCISLIAGDYCVCSHIYAHAYVHTHIHVRMDAYTHIHTYR